MSTASTVTNADRWIMAVRLFTEWLTGHDYSLTTIDRLVRQLRRFARDHDEVNPWDVTAAQVEAWLGRLTCGASGMYQYRTMLRTFYGWACRSGWVKTNPTAHVSGYRRKHAPKSWAAAIAEWRRWLEAASMASNTITSYTWTITQLANETPVSSPWDMTTSDLTEWMAAHKWERETLRRARSALRSFFKWSVAAGYMVDSPAADLPTVRASTACPRAVPEDAYRRALMSATGDDELMIRLAGELGLRRAEVATLHSRDLVNEGAGWALYVRGKGDKTRRLPVPDSLARQLYEREAGWVFPSPKIPGRPIGASCVDDHVTRHLPEGYTMHKLRHRFATQVYAVSHDLLATQRLLGHSSPTVTQRYVQLPDETARRLVEAVAW